MEPKKKSIFKKIFLPVIEIVVVFAILSFTISYFSIDRFVRENAKERIDEAFELVKEKKSVSKSSGTSVYIYDENFEPVTLYDDTAYTDQEMLEFLSSLLSNYELEENVLTNLKRNDKEYLVKLYTRYDIDIMNDGMYYVVLQELTNKSELIKDNFLNIFIVQLIVLFAVGIIVYKIQSNNEEEARKQKTIYENVAHDLRTPLVSILGYADGLKQGIIKDKDKACDIILKTGNQLKEMIENILVLSRFDNETYTSSMEEINLIDLITEQIETLKVIDDSKNISFDGADKFVGASCVSPIIKTDRKLVTRIIQNLLSNAMKYAKKDIIISLSPLEISDMDFPNTKCNIKIEIKDDGVGIEESSISHVFERYYKGSDGHFGIGLAVVKSSVEFLGGDILVSRVEPHGTKFSISL